MISLLEKHSVNNAHERVNVGPVYDSGAEPARDGDAHDTRKCQHLAEHEYHSIALQTRESGAEARTGACAYVESMKNLITYDIASMEKIAVEAPANAECVSTIFASSGLFASTNPSASSPVDSVTYAARVPTITRKPLIAAYVSL